MDKVQFLSDRAERELSERVIHLVTGTLDRLVEQEGGGDGRFLTREKAASYCDVSKSTIDNWVTIGLPKSKIGRVVLFDKEDLDQFIIQYKE